MTPTRYNTPAGILLEQILSKLVDQSPEAQREAAEAFWKGFTRRSQETLAKPVIESESKRSNERKG